MDTCFLTSPSIIAESSTIATAFTHFSGGAPAESPFQFGSVHAKVAQLVVVDAIFQEYCLRNRESCQESIQAIASALSVLHV